MGLSTQGRLTSPGTPSLTLRFHRKETRIDRCSTDGNNLQDAEDETPKARTPDFSGYIRKH